MGHREEVRLGRDARDDSRQGPDPDQHGAICRAARSSTPNAGPIARHALEFYSKLWFPYPFPQLTLQDGPSAGMEYPMVINSNQGAADHETGHQWWPMMVSNNETWYGWMDEGFNQYMNILSDADARGTAAEPQRPRPVATAASSGNEAEPPMMWNANYAGPQFYSFQTYSKTPLMLSMLGGIVGDSAVQRAHQRVREDVDVQAPVAVGLHVLHEQRAQAGPRAGSGTTGCSRPRRWTARSQNVTTSGRHDDGHRAAGRPDAVAGGAEGEVRAERRRRSSR